MASQFLKNIDILADDEAPIHRINLDGKTVYHSTFGGFCTILIAMAFCVVLYIESEDIILQKYPFVQSKDIEDYYQEPVPLKDLPRLAFAILDAGRFHKLDRSKLDVYAMHIK